jgi:hypothetical protein
LQELFDHLSHFYGFEAAESQKSLEGRAAKAGTDVEGKGRAAAARLDMDMGFWKELKKSGSKKEAGYGKRSRVRKKKPGTEKKKPGTEKKKAS